MSVRIYVLCSKQHETYQVDDASRVGLLGSLLGEEQQTLSGVGSPGGVLVGSLWLLATKVAGEVLALNGLSSQVEELLLEDEAPARQWLAIIAYSESKNRNGLIPSDNAYSALERTHSGK